MWIRAAWCYPSRIAGSVQQRKCLHIVVDDTQPCSFKHWYVSILSFQTTSKLYQNFVVAIGKVVGKWSLVAIGLVHLVDISNVICSTSVLVIQWCKALALMKGFMRKNWEVQFTQRLIPSPKGIDPSINNKSCANGRRILGATVLGS